MPKTGSLKELKNEVDLLHQIIEIISLSTDHNALLQQIARVLAEHFKGDSCFIYLIETSTLGLTLLGAWPPHPYQIGKIKMGTNEGLTGWVLSHKKNLIINKNAYKDARFKYFHNLPEDRYEAFLSVPILLKDESIGVINIQNKKAKDFTKNQIKLLNAIACQISGAIEKSRLIKTAALKARQLETISHLSSSIVSSNYLYEILQLIVTMTAQMMNSKICSLMLLDKDAKELRIEATQSLSEEYRKKPHVKIEKSISGRAVITKKTVVVPDVLKEPLYSYPDIAKKEGLVSMLAVPMLIKDKPIGVINCYTTAFHNFTEEELDILQTIANQSAVAIENTRLIEESRAARDALETRKLIERAKGLLMKQKNMTEQDAFQFIQKQAMNLRRTMREVAEAILLSEGLKQ
ncbi:MAG: GAF domain-containing protein [Endomicrobiales bacterium]|nr:GAF domain-containing protein [Endomicrobiales bacterium]